MTDPKLKFIVYHMFWVWLILFGEMNYDIFLFLFNIFTILNLEIFLTIKRGIEFALHYIKRVNGVLSLTRTLLVL